MDQHADTGQKEETRLRRECVDIMFVAADYTTATSGLAQ